jgi:hypothetical protein
MNPHNDLPLRGRKRGREHTMTRPAAGDILAWLILFTDLNSFNEWVRAVAGVASSSDTSFYIWNLNEIILVEKY